MVLAHGLRYVNVVQDINIEKLLGIALIALVSMVVLVRGSARYFLIFVLMASPALVIWVVHGYVLYGLLLVALIGFAVANSGVVASGVLGAYTLLFVSLVTLVVMGVDAIGVVYFLRDMVYPYDFMEKTIFYSISKFSYLFVVFVSIFTYLYLRGRIPFFLFLFLVAASLAIVGVVTESRLSTFAVLLQIMLVAYAKMHRFSMGIKAVSVCVLLIVAITIAFSINPRFEKVQFILSDVAEAGAQKNIENVRIRAKVWVGTYLAFIESPFIGYGAHGAVDKFWDIGVTVTRGGPERVLPVHGSFAKIALSGGGLALLPYLLSIICLFEVFRRARRVDPPVAYGALSLLLGGVVVQFGGDFFLQIMFVTALGFFLSRLSPGASGLESSDKIIRSWLWQSSTPPSSGDVR